MFINYLVFGWRTASFNFMGGAGFGIIWMLLGKEEKSSASLFIENQLSEGGLSNPGFRIWFSFLTDYSFIFFSFSNPRGREGTSASGKSMLRRVGGELSINPGLRSIGASSSISSAGLGWKGGRILSSGNLLEIGEDTN